MRMRNFINLALTKCSAGATYIFLPGSNSNAQIHCSTNVPTLTRNFGDYFKTAFKNPYKPSESAIPTFGSTPTPRSNEYACPER